MTGTTPLDWFSMCLMGAPISRRLLSSRATPPPLLDSCRAALTPREMDSMLSSMRTRKQETGSPRWALPRFRKVGVAGWKRPEMISSVYFMAACSSPSASSRATATQRWGKSSR